MMVSTKGRYALRVMIDLAEHCEGHYVAMKDVAHRQDISLKYLEKIVPALVKNKLVEGIHGKGGGYKLTRTPAEYTVWEILKTTEGDLAPVACLCDGAEPCVKTAECKTKPMWDGLNEVMQEYLGKITIEDLIKGL